MPGTNEKRVKDIMTPIEEYSTVGVNNTVKDAITVLKKSFCPDDLTGGKGHRSILVLDENEHLVGILTLRALLKAVEPQFIKVDQWAVPVFWEGLFTDRCREESSKKVRDIMVPIKFISLDADDTIIKAVHAMIKHKLGSLPVAKNGTVVGMVRITEIFHEISNLVADQPGIAESLPALKSVMSY